MPKESQTITKADIGTMSAVLADQPPAAQGPCLVTIIANGPVRVIVETLADRERHENGNFALEAQKTGHYVVTEGQSLRIVSGS